MASVVLSCVKCSGVSVYIIIATIVLSCVRCSGACLSDMISTCVVLCLCLVSWSDEIWSLLVLSSVCVG